MSVTESGLRYQDTKTGRGPVPQEGEEVRCRVCGHRGRAGGSVRAAPGCSHDSRSACPSQVVVHFTALVDNTDMIFESTWRVGDPKSFCIGDGCVHWCGPATVPPPWPLLLTGAAAAAFVPSSPGRSVIRGLDEGVSTMQEGGRRILVIPPELAYGRFSSPPDVVRAPTSARARAALPRRRLTLRCGRCPAAFAPRGGHQTLVYEVDLIRVGPPKSLWSKIQAWLGADS